MVSKVVAAVRAYVAIPAVMYSLIAVASVLWLVGLADQVHDPVQIAKYVGLSLLIAAVVTV